MTERVGDLIEAADMNALLRVVDAYCSARRWDDLLDVADMCEEAVERGKQLWPIADHIDYRIALEGPPELAAAALSTGSTRFTLGPLTEVAASTHTWDELVPYIEAPHLAAYVAQERVLRGENLTRDPRVDPGALDLPLSILDFEPAYSLATYRSNLVEVAEPWDPRPLVVAERKDGAPVLDEQEVETALLDLVHAWTAESNGAAAAVVVEGDVVAAISALTFDGVRLGPLDREAALQRMAWAAAAGGAHGRRRGAALGRLLAWSALAAIAGEPWPAPGGALAAASESLEWFRWDEGEPEKGWVLRLAVQDREQGWAAAIGASDLVEEGDG